MSGRPGPLQAGGVGQVAPGVVLCGAPGWVGALRRDTNARLIMVGAAALLAGAGAAWLVSKGGPDRPVVPILPFTEPIFVLVGWSLIGSGLLAWRSRPDSHLGPVLIFTGFAWFASTLPDAHNPAVFTIGEAINPLYIPGLLYLILSFPAGRLRGALDRTLMLITIALATVVTWTWLLFADSHRMLCRTCPPNLMEIARKDTRSR